MKKPSAFARAEVVITDSDDPLAQVSEPGTYALVDMVRGVYESIDVAADGSRRVVETVSVGARVPPAVGVDAHVQPPFELIHYQVGKPLVPSRTRWPE